MINAVQRFMSEKRFLVVCAVALLAVGSVIALIVLSGGDEAASVPKKSAPSSESPSAGFRSEIMFESFDQMVATSDLVVTGTVTEVRSGPVTRITHDGTTAYPEGTNAVGAQNEVTKTPSEDLVEEVRDLNAVVKIDKVLKGSVSTDTVIVKTLETAYAPPNTEWREPEKRVLLFLSPSTETPGLYIPARASYEQTVYVIQGNDLVATSNAGEEPVSARVASLSLPQLLLNIENVKARIASGEVKPLELER